MSLSYIPQVNSAYDKALTAGMIGLQVLITLVIAAILTIIAMVFMSSVDLTDFMITAALSVGVATIVWTRILFKPAVFDCFFINVKSNYCVVLSNQWQHDNIPPSIDARVKMFERRSLREVGQGFHGKFPWEGAAEAVDLKSEVLIGSKSDGKPLTCYTEDGIQVEVSWQVVLTPLVGFAVFLIRRNEEAIKAYFKGEFEAALIKWVKENPEDAISGKVSNLRNEFSGVFKGSNIVDDREMEWGIFTNDPQIFGLKRSDNYQKAAEGKVIGDKIGEIVKNLTKAFGDYASKVDQNLLLVTAASTVGNDVDGVLLIPGSGSSDMKEFMKTTEALAKTTGIRPSGGETKKGK